MFFCIGCYGAWEFPSNLSINSHFVQMWFYQAIYAHFACFILRLNRLTSSNYSWMHWKHFSSSSIICIIQIVCKLVIVFANNIICRHRCTRKLTLNIRSQMQPKQMNAFSVAFFFALCSALFQLFIFSLFSSTSTAGAFYCEWSVNNCCFHCIRILNERSFWRNFDAKYNNII